MKIIGSLFGVGVSKNLRCVSAACVHDLGHGAFSHTLEAAAHRWEEATGNEYVGYTIPNRYIYRLAGVQAFHVRFNSFLVSSIAYLLVAWYCVVY